MIICITCTQVTIVAPGGHMVTSFFTGTIYIPTNTQLLGVDVPWSSECNYAGVDVS